MMKSHPPSSAHRQLLVPAFQSYSARSSPLETQNYSNNLLRDRPPKPPSLLSSFNFGIELWSSSCFPDKAAAARLIEVLSVKPHKSQVFDRGFVAGAFYYHQWVDTLETMVQLWEIRLNRGHDFMPRLKSLIEVPSEKDELDARLRPLFIEKLKGLLEGEAIKIWEKKLGVVLGGINTVMEHLKRRNTMKNYYELVAKKEGLIKEKELIEIRIEEFKNGVDSLLDNLEDKEDEIGERVYQLGKDPNWERLHYMMMRECRRLEDGLPIYSYRKQILDLIRSQQTTVLIGETGSGKSTQLVQFLADSGLFCNGSIVCTQPRKLAASSLAQRVKEESYGCYRENSVVCYPSYSSAQRFDSEVVFMTDNCLLRHYMNDTHLSQISCIVIDEAHERSLNTDLLLAMIKKLLCQRKDLKLVIMSATADSSQLSDYFFGCGTFHVAGRNFPVDISYIPCESGSITSPGMISSYASNVLKTVTDICKKEKEGTILAFLTSQFEVEWACQNFQGPYAIAVPLHGKLSYEEQHRVFLNYPGKRKVIFTTNIAETSLTIPGVKYVVDSGMVKESRFDPGSGMSVLQVCRVSQSSANQRAGRAGRTEPGHCYRLYSEEDFERMSPHSEPEIRRVHLGVAVLKIIALGVNNVLDFDFIDAPGSKAVESALSNLVQLGAVAPVNDVYELTEEGRELVKLGVEPRLGKMILKCFEHGLGKEGVILAAVMANSSKIFCRVGPEKDKLRSDSLKVQFCHQNGDLFTLLSVYKEWEAVPHQRRKSWCWDNSINAVSMRRCEEAVQDLESCLQNELTITIPSCWRWSSMHPEHDETLKNVILSAFADNVAMYSGCDLLGYEVLRTGKHIQLHPSCALLSFDHRPSWVVFGEILSVSNEYLLCVTAVDFKSLFTLSPPLPFNFHELDSHRLQARVLSGFGSMQMKRFCGKSNCNLRNLVSRIRAEFMDERINVDVKVDRNEFLLYASSKDMPKVYDIINDALEYERRLLLNECSEKCLYSGGPTSSSPIALFGSGAEIKHLELGNRCLTVDIIYSHVNCVSDKELLMFLERQTSGTICAVHKFSTMSEDAKEKEVWGRVTFLTPDAAKRAIDLNQVEFCGGVLSVVPSQNTYGADQKSFPCAAVKVKISWPRRLSRGFAFLKCREMDVYHIVHDLSCLSIRGKPAHCEPSRKSPDSVVITGLDKEIPESEILEAATKETRHRIDNCSLLRDNPVGNPPLVTCEEALMRHVSSFMPIRNPSGTNVRIHVFEPGPRDPFMKASVVFDGSLHLEAARALEQINGIVLPGFEHWQKIQCQQLFHSSLTCPASVYFVIKHRLDYLVSSFSQREGVECDLEINESGFYRVKLSATSTKTVADLRRPLEELMKGTIVNHESLSTSVMQLLFSRDGFSLMKSIARETRTYISFDKHFLKLRVYGLSHRIELARQRLVDSLLSLYDSKQLVVHLRGGAGLPCDLMKKVVQKFGSDLRGLKEKVPDAVFSLNTKHHSISISGGNKDAKLKVENIISEFFETGALLHHQGENTDASCPICLCEIEDCYKLQGCGHQFCTSCLVEQCESAIKSHDNIPIRCVHTGCQTSILLTDLKCLLPCEKLEDLFRASLGAFIAKSQGAYRFCPSPDCPSVYQVTFSGNVGTPFVCGACFTETCTKCHLEYHPQVSCEMYQEFKRDPDSSLKEWCVGKENVKKCPVCGWTIEKVEGCNHIECMCGKHVCWVCLEFFESSDLCYGHLREVHFTIM